MLWKKRVWAPGFWLLHLNIFSWLLSASFKNVPACPCQKNHHFSVCLFGKKTLNVKFLVVRFLKGIFFPFDVMEIANGPWLRDKRTNALSYCWNGSGEGWGLVWVFGSFLAGGGSVFAWLGGQMGFGAELSPAQKTCCCYWTSLDVSPYPWWAAACRNNHWTVMFWHQTLLGETLTNCMGVSGENWAPHLFPLSVMEALKEKKIMLNPLEVWRYLFRLLQSNKLDVK